MSEFWSDRSSTSILHVGANSEDSGETARMRRLAWAFTGHLCDKGNRSFRTQVISYPSHFVPFWSFRTHFYFQFGHFVPISYPVWSFHNYFLYFLENRFGHFVSIFYCFVPKSFRTRSHYVSNLIISYPGDLGHFVPTSKLATNWLRYDMIFFFAVICYFQTSYELTLIWYDFLFLQELCMVFVWFARC